MKIRIGSSRSPTGRDDFERAAPRMRAVAARVDGGGRPVEVGLVGERRMAMLNRRYKGRRGAAEILTFDYGTGRGASPEDPRGEILICWKRLEARARGLRVSPGAYLLRLLAHGLCHICGYSHGTENLAARMEAAERRALGSTVSRRDLDRLFGAARRR